MKNKIKFELKAILRNLVIKGYRLTKKSLIVIAPNEKQILKVVDGRSSIINFTKNDYLEILFTEIENIIDVTGKKARIIKISA